jgi:hypothetical protein
MTYGKKFKAGKKFNIFFVLKCNNPDLIQIQPSLIRIRNTFFYFLGSFFARLDSVSGSGSTDLNPDPEQAFELDSLPLPPPPSAFTNGALGPWVLLHLVGKNSTSAPYLLGSNIALYVQYLENILYLGPIPFFLA